MTTLESIHPVTGEVVLVKIIMRQKRQTSDCIHFYNLLIRKVASILGMVQMNRSYYNPHSPIILNSEKYLNSKYYPFFFFIFDADIIYSLQT